MKYSVLDLAPIPEGSHAAAAIANTVDLAQLAEMITRYQPDEMILTGQIHDHAARLRSFEIAADVMASLGSAQGKQLAGAASL